MKESDLLISHRDGVYFVKVCGRANFEYAVPLRELAKTLDNFRCVRMDMTECLAMDSTFMGVLSMIGLKAKRCDAKVELVNASEFLTKLLRDLGVVKLFDFVARRRRLRCGLRQRGPESRPADHRRNPSPKHMKPSSKPTGPTPKNSIRSSLSPSRTSNV